MVRYGSAWRGVCFVLGALGLVAAVLMLPLGALAVLGLLILVGGLIAATGYEPGDSESPRYTRGRTVLGAVTGCAAVAAAVGLATVLGVAVLWLSLFLAGVSPPAVRWYGRGAGSTRVAAGRHDVPICSTPELCRQWHDSYEDLEQAETPVARLRVVMARQRCLDELERRDPEGLNAWLASTASAAGDPSRYLAHTDAEPPADT
jgi:hypothetical protein